MKIIQLFLICLLWLTDNCYASSPYLYQLKIYHCQNEQQEERVEHYLREAFVPALHRANIEAVGIFKPIAYKTTSLEKCIYVFIPYASFDLYLKLEETLTKDGIYQRAGADYIQASYNTPPYHRIETILIQAFPKSPIFNIPKLQGNRKDRVYELRSYEGPTEKLYKNKVEMFNLGDEIGLFKRLGFNAVFYGEVLAGSKMPNLMYLTTFENMVSREEHWKAFNNDPYWKKLSSSPNYQHNVSHADIVFLHPTDYSDL